MDVRQSTRNAGTRFDARRISVGDIQGSGERQFFMERRGDGVPTILRETRDLSGKNPEYQLIDNSDLVLTISAAATDMTPATAVIQSRFGDTSVPEVEVCSCSRIRRGNMQLLMTMRGIGQSSCYTPSL